MNTPKSDDDSLFENLADNFLGEFDSAIEEGISEIFNNSKLKEIYHSKSRYTEESFIDEGGMKKIISYRDSVTDRTIAMATMKKCERKIELEAFIDEARILASLEHPNIVPVYDIGTGEDELPYFTMKKMSGENLRTVVDKLKSADPAYLIMYPQTELLEIFLKVCDAISYAHSRGIVHLDLKPANIQVDEYGQVLVCDWGLARQLSHSGRVEEKLSNFKPLPQGAMFIDKTLDGLCKGTPGFMAPEQISDSCGLRTTKTDIYSLGALLYTLLSYRDTLRAGDVKQLMDDTLNGAIIPLESHDDCDIDRSLIAVVEKALSLNPNERYDTVSKLAHDIRAFKGGFATGAEDPGLGKRLRLTINRHKALSATILFSSLLILVLVSTFIISLNKEKNRALASEEIAVSLVEKLNTEKTAREKFNRETAPKLYNTAMLSYLNADYTKALEYSQASLTLDPQSEKTKLFTVLLLAGALRSQEALDLLQQLKDPNESQWLADICRELLNSQGENQLPSLDTFYKVYWKVVKVPYKKRLQLYRHMSYKLSFAYPLEQRFEFIRRVFKKNNGKLPFTFDLQQKGKYYSLSLKGNRGSVTTIDLQHLPIENLDLSNTAFQELEGLHTLPLKKLNIAGSKIVSLKNLQRSTTLEELNIADSRVYSLQYLTTTRIQVLTLGKTPVELYILKECKSLKKLFIPRGVYSEEELQNLNLSHLVHYLD